MPETSGSFACPWIAGSSPAMTQRGERTIVSVHPSRHRQGHREVRPELLREVAAHARMHAALAVVELGRRRQRQRRRMPDARMEIDAEAAVAVEADEFLRRNVVAWQ